MITAKKLQKAIEESWTRKTSSDPIRWTPHNPSGGQCIGTALVLQDYLGGDILWTKVYLPNEWSTNHYINNINGEEFDLTKDQLPKNTLRTPAKPKTKGFKSTREYLLDSKKVQKEYFLLKKLVEEYIHNEY